MTIEIKLLDMLNDIAFKNNAEDIEAWAQDSVLAYEADCIYRRCVLRTIHR